MHQGIAEMTGFHWQSPWLRADAWRRRMDT